MALILSSHSVFAQSTATNSVDVALQNAEQALQAAEAAHAPTLASDAYQVAKDACQQALVLQAKRKSKEIMRYTAQCIRYAELASNQAQYMQLKHAVEVKVSENAALRRSLLLGQSLEGQ
ncbi:MAG: DUF4398 domain-containing protein [Arenimonas sp.]|nr:DUF4398 domain-containing protein [Arenimonas sp.]